MPDIRALFGESARTYDLLNHLFSLHIDRWWRAALVRRAALVQGLPAGGARRAPGARVLDVCTGTGDVAIGLARRLPSARITGVDFSEPMLELGRLKVRRRGLEGRVELVRGDALRLPFEDGGFDAVTVAFGLRNLTDRRLGIREMVRVLRPGGRLLVLELSPPPAGRLGRLYAWYLGRWMPALGGSISGSRPTYRWLFDSVMSFPRPREVAALMEEEGLEGVSFRPLTGGIAWLHGGVRAAGAGA